MLGARETRFYIGSIANMSFSRKPEFHNFGIDVVVFSGRLGIILHGFWSLGRRLEIHRFFMATLGHPWIIPDPENHPGGR